MKGKTQRQTGSYQGRAGAVRQEGTLLMGVSHVLRAPRTLDNERVSGARWVQEISPYRPLIPK